MAIIVKDIAYGKAFWVDIEVDGQPYKAKYLRADSDFGGGYEGEWEGQAPPNCDQCWDEILTAIHLLEGEDD